MAGSYDNVYFLGVARMEGGSIIIASFSYNTETDLGGVKQVLDQPNMSMVEGKHYTFSAANMGWHLIKDDMRLIYILISQANYPQRAAHMCLEELQRLFVAKAGEKATTAKEKSLDKACSSLFLKVCQKYDNLTEIDKLASLTKKVDAVKLTMQENVEYALQNCVKLESIERAAEELQQQAGVFKRNANELKKKMWWKNMRMKLAIAAIVLVILGIIIAIIAVMTKKSS